MDRVFGSLLRRKDLVPGQRDRLRHRRVIYTGAWIFLGLELGIVTAELDLVWLDAVAAAYVLLVLGLAAVALRRRKG